MDPVDLPPRCVVGAVPLGPSRRRTRWRRCRERRGWRRLLGRTRLDGAQPRGRILGMKLERRRCGRESVDGVLHRRHPLREALEFRHVESSFSLVASACLMTVAMVSEACRSAAVGRRGANAAPYLADLTGDRIFSSGLRSTTNPLSEITDHAGFGVEIGI